MQERIHCRISGHTCCPHHAQHVSEMPYATKDLNIANPKRETLKHKIPGYWYVALTPHSGTEPSCTRRSWFCAKLVNNLFSPSTFSHEPLSSLAKTASSNLRGLSADPLRLGHHDHAGTLVQDLDACSRSPTKPPHAAAVGTMASVRRLWELRLTGLVKGLVRSGIPCRFEACQPSCSSLNPKSRIQNTNPLTAHYKFYKL